MKQTLKVLSFILTACLTVGLAQQEQPPAEQEQAAQGPQIQIAEHETHGSYLVDAEGQALYIYLEDTAQAEGARMESTCYDECAENWPPFTTDVSPLPDDFGGEGVEAGLLNVIERADGTLQVTYNNWPLHYFAGDETPGDIEGHNVDELWYLMSPEGEPIGVEERELP